MNWYFEVWRKYAVFSGRARRKEYWYFVLCHLLIGAVLAVVDFSSGLHIEGFGVLGSLYMLAAFIPSLAVNVRRLHDTGRSGWWFLIIFIPYIGGIVLIVFQAFDSQPGENKYGPNPKEGETPLHHQANQWQPDIGTVKELIESGADVNARNADGCTPLHYAAKRGWRLEMIKALIEAGADASAKDNRGRIPLDYAYAGAAARMLRDAGGLHGSGM